jgi:hypothetical protein
MSPRWLHWPAAGGAVPVYTISGTFDSGSLAGGAIDENPNASPSLTGLDELIARGTDGQNRINIVFDTGEHADALQNAAPDGSTAVLNYDSTTYTAVGYTWGDFTATIRINGTDFDSFPSAFISGNSYTLEFYA